MTLQVTSQPPPDLVPAAIVFYEPDPEILAQLLMSLNQRGRRIYIFVNGPLDASSESLIGQLTDTVVLRSEINAGLGNGLNTLVDRAALDGFNHILLLDQDSTPAPDLPEALRARFEVCSVPSRPLAAIAPLLVPPKGERFLPIGYAWRDAGQATVDFLPTSGSLLSLAAWKAVGPFRADYFIDGIDVEWGFRAWSCGYGSMVEKALTMTHRWGTPTHEHDNPKTPQILRLSNVRSYYYIRNAVDSFRLPHVPLKWKLRRALRLTGQIARLLHSRNYDAKTRGLVRNAISSAVKGRFGPIYPDEQCELGTAVQSRSNRQNESKRS